MGVGPPLPVPEEPRGFSAELLQSPVPYARKGRPKMNKVQQNFKEKGKKKKFYSGQVRIAAGDTVFKEENASREGGGGSTTNRERTSQTVVGF